MTRAYDRTLNVALRPPVRHPAARRGAAGGNALPVLHHAYRLHSQPGQRLHVRRDHGRTGHLLRVDGEAPARRRRHRPGAIRTWPIVGVFVPEGNQAFMFAQTEAARRAPPLGGRDRSPNCARKLASGAGHDGVPAKPAAHHRQRPVLHQRVPDDAAEREPPGDLQLGAAAGGQNARPAGIRRRELRPANRQPASDGGYRPRPRAGIGRHAGADSERALRLVREPPGVHHLHAGERIRGDHGGGAAVPAHAGSALETVHTFGAGRPHPARGSGAGAPHGRPAERESLRATAGGHCLVQSQAGLFAGRSGAARERGRARSAHARHHHHQFSGHRERIPALVPGPFGAADRGDPGDLHRAGDSVRELHPPHHDPLGPALGGVRRAADSATVPQRARSVRVCGADHAVRRGEEERHHDDRLRARGAERSSAAVRATRSTAAASCGSARS